MSYGTNLLLWLLQMIYLKKIKFEFITENYYYRSYTNAGEQLYK